MKKVCAAKRSSLVVKSVARRISLVVKEGSAGRKRSLDVNGA